MRPNKLRKKQDKRRELEELGGQFIEDVEGLPHSVKKEMGIV